MEKDMAIAELWLELDISPMNPLSWLKSPILKN